MALIGSKAFGVTGPLARPAMCLFAGAGLFIAGSLTGCGGSETDSSDDAMAGGEMPSEMMMSEAEITLEEMSVVYAELQTNLGNIVIELDKENAPISTANFVSYAEKGSYDGTIFHRVIDGFMIQGGGYEADLDRRAADAPIENEWQNGLSNLRGTVAMARLGNQPDSATNQFFINVSDNDFLDRPRDGAGYAVFGRVVDGMDVVDQIKAVPTTTRGELGDVPVEPVVIESARVLSASESAPYLGDAG